MNIFSIRFLLEINMAFFFFGISGDVKKIVAQITLSLNREQLQKSLHLVHIKKMIWNIHCFHCQ